MKRAILHIGTEKTGTTSIQIFLHQNRRKLGAKGFLFPATAGFISNQRLVVFGKKAPEPDLAGPDLDVSDSLALARWKESFVLDHCSEVLAFHARHRKESTVVYSSEHMQSRLTTVDEIKRIARLLRPMFDDISVVVYLRRQDRYALSAYSTSVRGGNEKGFSFEVINAKGPYYNYRELLENWSRVFGEESLEVRVFEKSRLHGNDVVSDFCSTSGIDLSIRGLRMPAVENEALSWSALKLLRIFNALPEDDPRFSGYAKTRIRPFLLEQVQLIEDSFGRVLPSRDSAVAFYDRFRSDNAWLAERWLSGRGFDESFTDYPLEAAVEPELAEAESRLQELIEMFVSGQQSFAVGHY